MGTLYLVPTPVGNLEDMTFRAVRLLKEADVILAEDTRTSGILLKHYDIHKPLLAHHKFNEHGTSASIVERLKSRADNMPCHRCRHSGNLRPGILPRPRGCRCRDRGADAAGSNGFRAGIGQFRTAV